jgi:hypothetical protein
MILEMRSPKPSNLDQNKPQAPRGAHVLLA